MFIKLDGEIVTEASAFEFEGSKFVDINFNDFVQERDKYSVIDGKLTDISNTDEYLNAKAQEQKQIDIQSLKKQITELDFKRIRALCEPDGLTGEKPPSEESWLAYYTSQIISLRNQLSSLEN